MLKVHLTYSMLCATWTELQTYHYVGGWPKTQVLHSWEEGRDEGIASQRGEWFPPKQPSPAIAWLQYGAWHGLGVEWHGVQRRETAGEEDLLLLCSWVTC